MALPLAKNAFAPHTFSFIINDEAHIDFGKEIVYNYFDQNRFFLGLAYHLNARNNLQSGYMNSFPVLCTGTPGLILREAARLALHLPFVSQGSQSLRKERKAEIIKFTLRPMRFLASFALHLLLKSQGSQSLRNGRKGEIIKFTLHPLRFLASFAINLPFVSQGSQSFRKERKAEIIKFTLRPLRFLVSFFATSVLCIARFAKITQWAQGGDH